MPLFAAQFFEGLDSLFRQIFDNIANGLFAFGSVADIIRAVFDVGLCALVFYLVLRLVKNTRAWQLLRGLIFIIIFSLFTGLLGLQTMNYILSGTISLLAIGLLVIFQPELRRALEQVGRKTGGLLSPLGHKSGNNETVHTLAAEISDACQTMAKEYCGALILIERSTPMAELADQANAVKVDAAVTSMNLQQIFYEGSPMHDGAVLIRNGKIYAARCHVPLSEGTRVKEGLGTRHRAAIGASEMGDVIGVVVSEERGTISLTLEGRLYRISEGQNLERILRRLLTSRDRQTVVPRRFWQRLRPGEEESAHPAVDEADAIGLADDEPKTTKRGSHRLKLLSFAIAFFLWIYVQSNTNPMRTVNVSVPVSVKGLELLEQEQLDFSKSDNMVELEIRTRKQYEDKMNSNHIVASLDFNDIDLEQVKAQLTAGRLSVLQKMSIRISVEGVFPIAYDVSRRTPATFYVSIGQAEDEYSQEKLPESGETTVVKEAIVPAETGRPAADIAGAEAAETGAEPGPEAVSSEPGGGAEESD